MQGTYLKGPKIKFWITVASSREESARKREAEPRRTFSI
jgi:hypothetical protein